MIATLAASSGGDARIALNALELAAAAATPDEQGIRRITAALVEEALQHRTYLYDQAGEAHYDTISAFIKSLRDSDPDAALYWLARMIEAGEDPLFVVRRMVILAAEDVGLADPQALVVATACQQAVHFVGMPEGYLPMAECAIYLATAPKSNSALSGYGRAVADARETRNDPVPLHLRNAVTGLMRELGLRARLQVRALVPGASRRAGAPAGATSRAALLRAGRAGLGATHLGGVPAAAEGGEERRRRVRVTLLRCAQQAQELA